MGIKRMKRRKRILRIGLIPRLWQFIVGGFRWVFDNPQPAIIVCVSAVIVWGLWGYVRRVGAFEIEHVHISDVMNVELEESIRGRDLWDVDIKALATSLQVHQPELKEIRVIRQLPNTLLIEAIERIPVAQIKVGWAWHLVDDEGFILSEHGAHPYEEVPRLTGLNAARPALKISRQNRLPHIQTALRILKLLRFNPVIEGKRLTEINVADLRQIKFIMDEQIEVRCGSEYELDAHLARLSATLKALALQDTPVGFIDLRFSEPVIGPRT